jgi:uncharacterized protein YdeI (YjbR/CyaY-like superfamily)
MPEPIVTSESARKWEAWLARNHARASGVWLRIFKKGSGHETVTYAEALDAALCYGWIDGQKRAGDAHSYLQRFCPRRARSGWSKVNTTHAERLIKEGKMRPAGLAQVDAAKKDGRWKAAYDPPAKSEVPRDFLAALRKDRKAHAFFQTLNRANVYAITYRLQTAKKPETRARRMQAILGMLARGEKFH